jgi:hypothetical protein
MRAFGRAAPAEGTCFLTGGATAVLIGWRSSTIDVDIALEPEQDELLRALPALKEQLRINVELASPAQFIPLPAGWEERSPFVAQEGKLTFRHFDLYSQALAKLERAHRRDADDVRAMVDAGLVDPKRLRAAYDEIESSLYRFPAVDARAFRARVEEVAAAI